jgi:hypothetical protein
MGRKFICLLFIASLKLAYGQQQWLWAKEFTVNYQNVRDVQFSHDALNNVYVSASNWDSYYGYPAGASVIKFDSTGNQEWTKTYSGKIKIRRIQNDEDGNVLIGGDFRDTLTIENTSYTSINNDAFLASLSPSGNLNWFKNFSGPGDEFVEEIYRAKDNTYFISGAFSDNTNFDGINLLTGGSQNTFIFSCNKSGQISTLNTLINTKPNTHNSGYRIKTDTAGNLFLLGYYSYVSMNQTNLEYPGPYSAQYLVSFDANLNCNYLKEVITGTEQFFSMELKNNFIYLTGQGSWTSGGWTKTKKYDYAGNPIWTKSHAGWKFSYSSPKILDNGVGLYTIGHESDPQVPQWVDKNSLMITEYEENGNESCTKLEVKGNVLCHDLCKLNNDQFLLLGITADSLQLGQNLLKKTNGNYFLAKFKKAEIIASVKSQKTNSIFEVFPNPNSGIFIVRFKDANISNHEAQIFSPEGRLIYRENFKSSEIKIDLATKEKGLYILQIKSPETTFRHKILIE